MLIEYAISEGEGTLIKFGIFDNEDDFWPEFFEGQTLIMSPCDEECETGK